MSDDDLEQARRLLRPLAPRLRRVEPAGSRPPDEAHQPIRDVLRPRFPKPGYLYLIAAPDRSQFKLGKSKNPVKRFRGLQLPAGSRLVHTIATSDMKWAEDYLHARYARVRLDGEWFRLSEAQLAEVCALSRLDPE